MAWILSTLWSGLVSGLRSAARSRASGSPVADTLRKPPVFIAPGACAPPADGRAKRFYSLVIEVRPEEADAETLQLFSDFGSSALAVTLNLPACCELRRCMEMSPESAEVLIRM
jgi:hypothetical protein